MTIIITVQKNGGGGGGGGYEANVPKTKEIKTLVLKMGIFYKKGGGVFCQMESHVCT